MMSTPPDVLEVPAPDPNWRERWREQVRLLDAITDELWFRVKRGDGDEALDLWIRACRARQKLYGLDVTT